MTEQKIPEQYWGATPQSELDAEYCLTCADCKKKFLKEKGVSEPYAMARHDFHYHGALFAEYVMEQEAML